MQHIAVGVEFGSHGQLLAVLGENDHRSGGLQVEGRVDLGPFAVGIFHDEGGVEAEHLIGIGAVDALDVLGDVIPVGIQCLQSTGIHIDLSQTVQIVLGDRGDLILLIDERGTALGLFRLHRRFRGGGRFRGFRRFGAGFRILRRGFSVQVLLDLRSFRGDTFRGGGLLFLLSRFRSGYGLSFI